MQTDASNHRRVPAPSTLGAAAVLSFSSPLFSTSGKIFSFDKFITTSVLNFTNPVVNDRIALLITASVASFSIVLYVSWITRLLMLLIPQGCCKCQPLGTLARAQIALLTT